MRAKKSLILSSLLSLSLAACGEELTNDVDDTGAGGTGGEAAGGTGGGGAGGTGGAGGNEDPGIVWESCQPSGAECAILEVPLDWNEPDGQKIHTMVRRMRGSAEATGQIWMLQGGPGYPGDDLAYLGNYFQQAGLDMDIYVPDYRGVGGSTRLACGTDNGSRGISASCMDELEETFGAEGLGHFGTTDAVTDIHHAMELFREEGEPVYLWGSSYGTLTGNRFLTLYPDAVDGAILDSMCHGSGCDPRQDRDYENLVREVAGLCAADELCSSKLGADPWSRIEALYQAFDEGHCAFAGAYTDMYFTYMLVTTMDDPTIMPYGLALVYRAERCTAADEEVLLAFAQALFGSSALSDSITDSHGSSGDGMSLYLNMHIFLSEFWPADLTLEVARQESEARLIERGSTLHTAEVRESWSWPFYEVPSELKQWADTDVPVLLLNGSLDPRTPTEAILDVEDAFAAPHQRFYEIPYAGHGALLSSADDPELQIPCGFYLTVSFFADPTGELDASCVGRVPGIDFDGDPRFTSYLFGTSDLWENDTTQTFALQAPLTSLEKYKLDRLKRRAAELRR